MKKQSPSLIKLTLLENADPIDAEMEQVQNSIRQRAFEISTMRHHSGREEDDWVSAESEIISVPPAEVSERDGSYLTNVAIAGADAGTFQVMASADQLLIKGEFRHEHHVNGTTVHLCDFRSAVIFRTIRFPERVDLKTMKIEFRDGVLRITVFKDGATPVTQKRQVVRVEKPSAAERGTASKAGTKPKAQSRKAR